MSTDLIREKAGVSEQFKVEGENERSEEDETREEEDVADVVWSIAAVRQRSVTVGLSLCQRPVDFHRFKPSHLVFSCKTQQHRL